jgi:hypothetical protein
LKINSITYNGFLYLVFDDEERSNLSLEGEFKVTRYNQTIELSPRSKEALALFYDLFNVSIKEAKADKGGNLFLIFENKVEIIVEDGPYENWHYTKRNPNNTFDSLFIHGGIGRTTIFEV